MATSAKRISSTKRATSARPKTAKRKTKQPPPQPLSSAIIELRSHPDLVRLGAHACLVARDAAMNLADGIANESPLAFVTVKECEAELDEIDRYVDEHIAGDISGSSPERAKELLATLKFVLDTERIGDLVQTVVGRARAYGSQLSVEDRADLHSMCRTLEQMLTNIHHSYVQRDCELAHAAIKLDQKMDILRTHIYSRQVNAKRRAIVALGLEIFLMAQALERAGDHAKNLAEEVCHLVEGRTMRHLRPTH